MAVAVLLLDGNAGDVRVSPRVAPLLGRLGVTHIRVVGDAGGYGLIVEGWSFDPSSADEVARLLGRPSPRLLRPVLDVAISDDIGGPSHA